MTAPKTSKAFALANAYFAGCQLVEGFLGTSVRPIIKRASETAPEFEACHGAIIRLHAWFRSLSKLDAPGDFQAVLSASRAVFEIAVDLTLLHRDPRVTVEMLVAWEESSKLAAARRLRQFCDSRPGSKKPAGAKPILAYLNQEQRVLGLRSRHWGRTKHPQRWTGRDLGRDAEEADRFSPSGFAEYYCSRYTQVCWNVHGSGLAGVRRIPESRFPALTMFGFEESARFAIVAAREALHLVGKWDGISAARFERLAEEMKNARVDAWVSHGADESE